MHDIAWEKLAIVFMSLSARIMTSGVECRKKAEECARLAREPQTRSTRVLLSNMERMWLRLADQCERLEELRNLMIT
jgi:hypothetical protein